MKIPIVTTEPITLRNTAEAASACATRYCRANMITIGMVGIAVVSTASLTMGLPYPAHRNPPKTRAGCRMFFRNTRKKTFEWL